MTATAIAPATIGPFSITHCGMAIVSPVPFRIPARSPVYDDADEDDNSAGLIFDMALMHRLLRAPRGGGQRVATLLGRTR